MDMHQKVRHWLLPPSWATALFVAGTAVALWAWLAEFNRVQLLLAAAALVPAAILGVVWQSRARAARRWRNALDTYAEREIARNVRRSVSERIQTLPTRRGAAPIHRVHSTKWPQLQNKA